MAQFEGHEGKEASVGAAMFHPKHKADYGKRNNGHTTGFNVVAKKAAAEYGSAEAGRKVAGAIFQRMRREGKA